MIQYQYILVIDDDPVIGDTLAEMLTDEGYIVSSVATRASAQSTILVAPRPALCLVDVGRNDLAVLEQLRTHGFAQVPLVAMTTSKPHAAHARAAGFACLDKPFDLDELLACVARYVIPQPLSIAVYA
jgi:DNA-binding response OmpR family regulator